VNEHPDRTAADDASASFGPETGFESESSVSDKAFFQEEKVQPIVPGPNEGSMGAEDAEFGTELAAPPAGAAGAAGDAGQAAKPGYALGLVALLTAVVSFFLLPSILGPVGAVVGFMAFAQGRRAMGGWAVALGLISFFIFLMTLQNTV